MASDKEYHINKKLFLSTHVCNNYAADCITIANYVIYIGEK